MKLQIHIIFKISNNQQSWTSKWRSDVRVLDEKKKQVSRILLH